MGVLVRIALAAGLVAASAGVFAQDGEEVEYGWEGTGEFGFVNTSGNTDSTALNLKLEFVNTTPNWRHRLTGTALVTDKNGEKDNERYTFEGQSDRKLSEKSYLLGVLRWDADKFGAYDPQTSVTVGYGRHLMHSETHDLKGEIGVGYRKLEERVTGLTSSDAIVRLLLNSDWQVFATTNWNNRLLIESGSDNTFTQFNSAAAISMTERFAVKLGFEIRNNSKLPFGVLKKTDTITTANLVYNF